MPDDPKPDRTPSEDDRLPDVSPDERRRLLTGLLRGVSRAFYLTLRVLPAPLREPVGLAYLLARAADTVADTRLLPPLNRLEHLLSFRKQIEGPASAGALRAIEAALTEKQAIPDERVLLQSLPQAFALLEALPPDDRAKVRDVVVTLTRGMEMDLRTFPAEDSGRVAALKTPDELDTYTYYVAGCVGEFWTRMLAAHTPALKHWDIERVSETGVRFGKALQLTNVLRDVPKDLRIGRCYLPANELQQQGLLPDTLLEASAGAKARPVLAVRLRQALIYFDAARDYMLAIPRRCVRLRLAVLWPILIGLGTLAKLARNDAWLDPARPSKVTRGWVYRMMLCSVPASLSNGWTSSWIGAWRRRVDEAL
ncbi:MAG: squalene/phytoene synthase family protein [Planctomycetes bacterium]|nr:squalene/phytoene synthase family protein [Planctomycetota bacterium]